MDQQRPSDLPGADQRLSLVAQRIEADVEADGVHLAAGLGPGEQIGGLGGVERQRLLADDVLPGIEDRMGLFGVEVVGGGEVHHVYVGVIEGGLQVGEGGWEIGCLRLLAGPLRARADHADHFHPEPAQRLDVSHADEPDPNDRGSDVRFHSDTPTAPQ